MVQINKLNLGILLEKIFLIIIFSILLFIGCSNLVDYRIKHNFPYGYLASDTFQHQIRAEAIKDAGNFRYEANYISMGLEKVVGRYPPILYHLAVIFSYSSGLEVYDAIYFIVFLFASLSALVIYLIIRKFNKNIALLSLPLSILIFAPGSYMGFTWGHWPSILSQFFLIAFFWSISKINVKFSFILIAIFMSAMALTHTSELIFGILFLIIFFIINVLNKTFKLSEVKTVLIAAIASFVISFYYFIIFKNTWAVAQPFSFAVMPVWEGNPGLYLINFGVLLIFIIIGAILSLLIIKKAHISLIIALSMLLLGFTNYIGFDSRAFQIRFFWPIYLSVLFGFSIYKLSRLVVKKWNILYSAILSIIFIILLIGIIKVPYVHHYEKISTPGIMNQYHWKILNWFPKNTKQDAKIYFFYGDIYNQDALLRNSKRAHYLVDPTDFIQALNNRTIKRNYLTESPGDGGGSLSYRGSFFKFKNYYKEKSSEYFFGKRDICNFDYYVFDKVSRQPALAQYNLLIASELIKKDFISKVFENEVSIILKNNKPGVDCIEERSF